MARSHATVKWYQFKKMNIQKLSQGCTWTRSGALLSCTWYGMVWYIHQHIEKVKKALVLAEFNKLVAEHNWALPPATSPATVTTNATP